MKIFFSGDDWVVPVTETVEIEKTTEEVSLYGLTPGGRILSHGAGSNARLTTVLGLLGEGAIEVRPLVGVLERVSRCV